MPELQPDRITAYLQAGGHDVTVSDVSAAPIGTGQMAASYRIRLTFDGDSGGVPSGLVAKVPVGPPQRRQLSANSYRTEVDFYRDLAPFLTARIPRVWAAWRNETGDEFALLLEDLAPRIPGDQIAGCSVDEAMLAVRNLAGVHGPLWGDERLSNHFDNGAITVDVVAGIDAVFPAMTDLYMAKSGDQLSDDVRAIYQQFAPLAGRFVASQPDRPGIVHGDYRLDNLLFSADLSDVAIVDWQTVGLGLSARDLSFFIATSLDTDVRREAESDLVKEYHRVLSASVGDYSLADFMAEYAVGMFQMPLVIMFGSAIAESTERGDEMFRVMATRGAAAMKDHGTLELC